VPADPVLGSLFKLIERIEIMTCVKLPSWFVVVALIVMVMTTGESATAQCPCVTQASGFAGGDGSPGDPYQVCLPGHLDNVRNHLSSSFLQTADIDMSGFTFSSIGSASVRFEGNYDGSGFLISNLNIMEPSTEFVGVFSSIGSSGIVVNVNVAGAVTGQAFVGCLAGGLLGSVSKTTANCVVTSTGDQCGGMVGNAADASILLSSTFGQVSGNLHVGGIVGRFEGTVSIMQDSYSSASVNATGAAGGLGGSINGATTNRCYASGAIVDKLEIIGGLYGFTDGHVPTIVSSFWDIDTTGQTTSVAGGTGKTTVEMMMQSTFDPPWDFIDTWMIDEGNDYPRLQVQDPGCIFDCQCDDELFCNGTETCDSNACIPGINESDGTPCGGDNECLGGACLPPPIPTVSEWGLIVMSLLLLATGTIAFGRNRSLVA
jgi:IPTL-CTERM motif